MNTARVVVPLLATSIAYAQPAPDADTRSADTAIGLSLGTTAAGAGLLALAYKLDQVRGASTMGTIGIVAIVVGPTLGHMYADDTWNLGHQVRVASVATAVVGAGLVISCIETCQNPAAADVGIALFCERVRVRRGGGCF